MRAFVLLLFFVLPAMASETIKFKQFKEVVTLINKGDHYEVEKTGQKVNLSNRLIVKATRKVNNKRIVKADKSIVKAQELYVGKKFRYFALHIEDGKISSNLIRNILRKKGIEHVQPDMLQIRQSAHGGGHTHKKITKEQRIARALPRYLKALGVKKLWKQTTGSGTRIAVIDDGFDLDHPDLKHVKSVFAYDAQTQQLNADPQLTIDSHGTKVAGIVFAAHNEKGVDGIAPNAELIAIRQPETWTSNTLLSFNIARSNNADIINCSWNSHWLLEPMVDIINDLSTYGRDGKGTAVIFAAGNDGKLIEKNSIEASIDSAIVVASSNFLGNKPLKTSNYGDSIDLLVYGQVAKTTLPGGKYGPFSGTSLASAIISGVSSLLLSENPQLTLNELQDKLSEMTTKRWKKIQEKRREKLKLKQQAH